VAVGHDAHAKLTRILRSTCVNRYHTAQSSSSVVTDISDRSTTVIIDKQQANKQQAQHWPQPKGHNEGCSAGLSSQGPYSMIGIEPRTKTRPATSCTHWHQQGLGPMWSLPGGAHQEATAWAQQHLWEAPRS
jgi:hypothetical protein